MIISQLLYYYTCGCDLEMNDFTLADLSKHCSSLFEEQLIIKSKGQGYLCMLCLEVKLIKDCSQKVFQCYKVAVTVQYYNV